MNNGLIGFPESQKTPAPLGGLASASSASGVTLTASSASVQQINMTAAGQYVTLPDQRSLAANGLAFMLVNMGQNAFGVQDAAGNVLTFIPPYGKALMISGSNAMIGGSWTTGNVSDFGTLAQGYFTTATSIGTTTPTGGMAIAALTSTTALMTFYTSTALYGTVLTISPTGSVSAGSVTQLGVAITANTEAVTIQPISATQAIITYPGASEYASIAVATVSGTTVSIGTAYNPLGSVSCRGGMSVTMLTATTGVMCGISTAETTLYSIFFTVSGNTLSFGALTSTTISAAVGAYISVVALGQYSAAVFWSGPSNALTGAILSVSGTAISVGAIQTIDNTNLTSGVMCAIYLTSASQLFLHCRGTSGTVVYLLSLGGGSLVMLSSLAFTESLTDANTVQTSPTSFKVFSMTLTPYKLVEHQIYINGTTLVAAFAQNYGPSTASTTYNVAKGALLYGTTILLAYFPSGGYPTVGQGAFIS